MALRALLFSSDGTSTSTLCQVLTELGIEAEICPEMLVAVQRISLESYDTILVDWDQENEAIALLKNARDQKTAGHALNIALVKNDKDLPRALQHGANSVIRKPVDPRLAKDTLSTARDLILSRRTEQKTKEERIAAAQAAIAAATAELAAETSAPAPKTGFVTQTAPRSAWEAAESSEQNSSGEPQPQASRPVSPAAEPESEVEESAPLPRKRWDDKPRPQEVPRVNVAPPETETLIAEIPRSQDATGVFSSLPEEVEEEPRAEPEKQSQPRYLVYALVGCLLVAAALWVWAPGSSFHGVAQLPRAQVAPGRTNRGAASIGSGIGRTADDSRDPGPRPDFRCLGGVRASRHRAN